MEYDSNKCITGMQLLDYIYPDSGMPPEEKARIKNHLKECEHCRNQVIKAQTSVESMVKKIQNL